MTTGIPTQTAASAATDLGISRSTLYRWIASGKIREHGIDAVKIKGRWVIACISDIPALTGTPAPQPAQDLDTRIRDAYLQLTEPGNWVSLTRLRPLIDAPRHDVDAALIRLERCSDVNIVPESNQKILTAEDRQAAVEIGMQEKHLIWIAP